MKTHIYKRLIALPKKECKYKRVKRADILCMRDRRHLPHKIITDVRISFIFMSSIDTSIYSHHRRYIHITVYALFTQYEIVVCVVIFDYMVHNFIAVASTYRLLYRFILSYIGVLVMFRLI